MLIASLDCEIWLSFSCWGAGSVIKCIVEAHAPTTVAVAVVFDGSLVGKFGSSLPYAVIACIGPASKIHKGAQSSPSRNSIWGWGAFLFFPHFTHFFSLKAFSQATCNICYMRVEILRLMLFRSLQKQRRHRIGTGRCWSWFPFTFVLCYLQWTCILNMVSFFFILGLLQGGLYCSGVLLFCVCIKFFSIRQGTIYHHSAPLP